MPNPFPGSDKLINAIDQAVSRGDHLAITAALRMALCESIRDEEIALPECVMEPLSERYARRVLYNSPTHGYSVIAMTWGPGQGTAVHDHSGMWCVEGVWHGRLEVTLFELVDQVDDRYRFVPAGTMDAGAGSAGSLIPPHEFHSIRNPSDRAVAVSLHVYQRPMESCGVFESASEGWLRRAEKKLGNDGMA
jgi:predicted metal-dependent enzyme (double-stranded beta helix superfamily)